MLNTLLKIGEWQSQGKGEWDRFLDFPKVERQDKKGNNITNYTLPIIFDLDSMEVVIDRNSIKEYDERDIAKFKVLRLIARNGKSFYVSVFANKIAQLYKTFFGKEEGESIQGEMVEFIEKLDSSLLTDKIKDLLSKIFFLKDNFYDLFTNEDSNKADISIKTIEEIIELGHFEKLVLITTKVKSEKHDYPTPIYFSEIPEYQEILIRHFFGTSDDEIEKSSNQMKLCYASGQLTKDVKGLDLSERYSLNKMFVTETKNYASEFAEKRFSVNYQVSKANQEKLDFASDFLLNHGYKVKIANIDHVIIPQFLESDNLDLDLVLMGIKKKTDLLFGFETLDNFAKNIKEETESVFWINFIAFESDGNFFKSTELIKDVSNFHFSEILKEFSEIDWEMRESGFVDWDSVMTVYGKTGTFFNFNTVYYLIPLRKDKEKKNKALDLFKAILENRRVDKQILFRHFCELMLCHYFERYSSYTNIPKSSKDYLGKTIKDSVFKYLAFLQILKKLNLIDMEETTTSTMEEFINRYDQAIQNFFNKMQLSHEQKAMFYLGRMLNAVEFIQKGKKKTVINKVNFNGLDRDDIQRLRISLIEKAKQYGKIGKVIFADRKFGELFDFNRWRLDVNEAVFFLLTGYSFGISHNEVDELEDSEELVEN